MVLLVEVVIELLQVTLQFLLVVRENILKKYSSYHYGKKKYSYRRTRLCFNIEIITNYLASVHLVAQVRHGQLQKKSNLDLSKVYKGIAVSSGNSFVHETESQVILNGSYNINFTMGLVLKDTGLFNDLAKKLNSNSRNFSKIVDIFKDGQKKYGSRAWSSMIVKRMEDLNNISFRAKGFPEELIDNEVEEKGYEI